MLMCSAIFSYITQVKNFRLVKHYNCLDMYLGLPYFPTHFGIWETVSFEEVSLYCRRTQSGKAHFIHVQFYGFVNRV